MAWYTSRLTRRSVLGAAIVVLGLKAFTVSVPADQSCAVTRGGRLRGVDAPGMHLVLPVLDRTHCYRTSAVFYEVLDDPSRSKADFTSGVLDSVTVDGQPVDMTFNVRYRVRAEKVGTLFEKVGRDLDDVQERVIKFHARTVTRQIVQTHRSDELYSGDLRTISKQMREELAVRFARADVVLEEFELKRPRFSAAFEQAVEAKELALQAVAAERNKAKVAEQEAARGAIVARAAAETSRLQQQVDAEATVAKARAEAEATRLNAAAEADAIAVRGKAVKNHPEIIALESVEALKAVDWAIFDSAKLQALLQIKPPGT